MEVGIIGNGHHSKRIQKILKKIKIKFFIYKKLKNPAKNTLEFNKLKKFKIIFIISPNNTHFYYLNLLKKNRYLFCEKPPVSNLKELRKLKKLNKYNIYFNFNKRFSHLSLILGNIKKYKFGKLIYANFILSHGLAQTKKYIGSWRSKIKLAKKGVFEIVSIHDIDLVNYLYKIKKIKTNSLENFSKIGNSYDTSNIQIELTNKAIVNIFSTYNSSLHDNAILMFENGFVEKNNNEITINGPTKTFNKRGFFIKPPKILSNKISSIKDYELSLYKSVNYFIKNCKLKTKFPRKNFDCSISTNEIILHKHKNK
tara:strand:+ start:981 stop:1916 length:936 start_codon:yes stop_codon:yes gene_type:complete